MQLLAYEYNYFGRGLVAIAMEVPPVYLLEKSGADPGLTVGGGGGGLSIPRTLARTKFYVLRPLLTSFLHTTCYTKKK